MKKLQQFLEQHVQWVALAVGALFLLWIVRGYVLTNPLEKPLGFGKGAGDVAPGNVDVTIDNTISAPLRAVMTEQHADVHIAIPTGETVLLPTAQTRPTLTYATTNWPVDESSLVPAAGQGGIFAANRISRLPSPPPLQFVDSELLRTVIFPDPAVPANHQDVDGVTTFWRWKIIDLDKEFMAAFGTKLLANQQMVNVARVVVMRQQLNSDGSWGETVTVQPVSGVTPPVSFDVASSNQREGLNYSNWVNSTANVLPGLLSAVFPQSAIDRPDLQWKPLETYLPYRAVVKAAMDTPIIDPVPVPVVVPGKADLAPAAPPVVAVVPVAPAPVQIPKLQPVPAAPFNTTNVIPGGDMGVYFHDVSAEPGQTYRYKVKYTLLNPVYGDAMRVSDPKLAAPLGIDSADSDWSNNIAVPLRTRFWCSAKQPPSLIRDQKLRLAAFTVYTWHDGIWRQKDYPLLTPGDEIGSNEGEAGNFVSRFTYLDQRQGGPRNETYLAYITPDDGGTAMIRELLNDTNTQEYKHFKRDFDAQTAGNAVNPTNPDAAAGAPVMPLGPNE